jgi:sulfonate transport system permease protein
MTGELPLNLWISTQRVVLGFFLGGSLGLALGILNGLNRSFAILTDSTLLMINNIPFLALIPLVVFWFGTGEAAFLFLISLAVLLPIYINTFHGVRSIDPDLIEMGRTYGLNRWALMRNIILPGALPSIFPGLKLALGYMWTALIAAETISGNSGIGYMGMNARQFLQTDIVILVIALYAVLGKISDLIAQCLERICMPWHHSYFKDE